MFKVLISDPISDQGIQKLHDAEDVEVHKQTGLSEEELIRIIGDYDALLVRSQTKVTEKIMEAGKNLKVIGRAGVGVDNIDLDAATKHGIIVINAPDGNTISTSEHTFAMMMAAARNIPQAYKKTISGEWDRKSFVGVELNNKTLGILGLGRIGAEVAKRARAFGMHIMAYDPFLTEERAEKLGVQIASIDEICRQADFITVHTPLTKETHHLISKPQFEQMKKGVRIINCARGGIIDESALLEAIDQGIVAGAAFDVFENEPPAPNHPFFSHPNIIVTPHLGASTVEAQENVAIDVSEEVLHILRGQPFKNAVNMPPVPANVMNKIQPYFELGEKMGKFIAQYAEGPVKEIQISVSGELSDVDTSPLVRYILKGVLSRHLGSDVNIVNVNHLAKTRDIHVIRQKSSATKGFTNLISLTLVTDQEEKSVAGTLLNGYGSRIVQINQYPVDIALEGILLVVSHVDKPGIIGQFGTILGNNDINIATMQVGRKIIGGEAIMVLTVDKEPSKEVIDQLLQQPEIHKVKQVIL